MTRNLKASHTEHESINLETVVGLIFSEIGSFGFTKEITIDRNTKSVQKCRTAAGQSFIFCAFYVEYILPGASQSHYLLLQVETHTIPTEFSYFLSRNQLLKLW